MHTIIRDRDLAARLMAERRARGADHHDEVWEGVYTVLPTAGVEHQQIVAELTAILVEVIGRTGLGKVFPGVNVSDRSEDWEQDYRCPDVAIRLENGRAEIRGAYLLGGPDFVTEVVSPDDQTYEKLPFYERVGTREVLVIDRRPWALVLYRLTDGKLIEAGRGTVDNAQALASQVVPLSFRLLPGHPRPQIEVMHVESGKQWMI